MLRPIKSPARQRRILTYDMEWFPGTLELRLIGVFDGHEYRTYTTPIDFLRGELVSFNSGGWYFAHAGGLADFQFLLQELVDKGYQVKAAFSGSSAIIVEITEGEKKWLLIDSYWLLRSPLKKIGEAVGIKKLKDYICPGSSMVLDPVSGKMVCDGVGCGNHPPPEDPSDPWCIFYAPMGELKTYNEQDNRILHKAICDLQEGLLSMGSELCMTQASSAMKLYRRVYLDRDIRTNKQVNERARISYVGSRVEVYRPRCDHAEYYDINSSFPYAMTFPAPGSLRGGRGSLPTGESEHWLADVEIEVPEMYLPPVPFRHPKEHRVYFPTGRWRSWLWGIDVRLLESVGGKVHKCHRVMEFSSHDTLASYAQDLYARRVACKTEFEKMLYKLLLNSLYGKFGESPLKQAAYFNPEDPAGMNMVMPGVFLCEEMQDIEHEHVPISTHITAFARRTLYRFNKLCLDLGGEIFYNDTDSCVTTIRPSDLPADYPWIPGTEGVLGKRLGQMKHEYSIHNGEFVAPKIYRLDATDVEKRDEYVKKGLRIEEATEKARKDVLRAKGFSRMTMSKFHDLVEGREIEVRRMSRVRELLREGVLTPTEEPIRKRLQIEKGEDGEVRFKMRTKRKMLAQQNDSRPWDVREIFDGDPMLPTIL